MGNEWRIIQRRGQLRIYLKDERDFEMKFKLSLLNLILQLQGVGKACKIMSIPVTTAYRRINDWNEGGKEGLTKEQGKGGGKPSNIIAFDGKQVTFWFKDSETKQRKTVTMKKFEFIRLPLSHIPEKNFKIVRYVGIHSRREYKHRQTEFHDGEIIFIKRNWREEIKKTFKYDPLICPYCETEMELIGTCYEGTESYPTEEPQPVEPPSDHRYSQHERILFITSVIKNNQNGRGVSIETVISEAVKIGMNREQAISYIEHLKQYGSAYEPVKGEIKCAF